jgi:hypothetical protein
MGKTIVADLPWGVMVKKLQLITTWPNHSRATVVLPWAQGRGHPWRAIRAIGMKLSRVP